MHEVRCKKCNKLLCKVDNEKINNAFINILELSILSANPKLMDIYYDALEKALQIKCTRCGEMNTNKESVENE